ncbi:hypothetical protein [Halarchaeum sp. P4]|uniref:hypothetical protein n=1 Tax=Halarchaeum sp. P4 TaxID=3421639 RepID=UPI003EBB712F
MIPIDDTPSSPSATSTTSRIGRTIDTHRNDAGERCRTLANYGRLERHDGNDSLSEQDEADLEEELNASEPVKSELTFADRARECL